MLIYDAEIEPSFVVLSDDGTQLLLIFEEIEPEAGLRKDIIIYDLENEERIVAPSIIEPWISIWNWSSDGRLKFLISFNQTADVGETRKYAIVTLGSGQKEIVEEILDLPDYIFNDTVLYSEIASTSPNQNFAIYNAFSD